jgi:hypothetical protein
VDVGGEADLGFFQQDLAPERNAERDEEPGVSAGKENPKAARHRSVEREIVVVLGEDGAGINTERADVVAAALRVHVAALETQSKVLWKRRYSPSIAMLTPSPGSEM